jgi:hypothetical protein
MSAEQEVARSRVMGCALRIAARPPLKHGPTTFAASVPWSMIEELRDAIDELGVDWREWKADHT